MKKLLILIPLFATLFACTQNVKISELPTNTAPADDGYVPVVLGGTTKKTMGKYLSWMKLDSVVIRNDSIFYYKAGGTEVFGGKVIGGGGSSAVTAFNSRTGNISPVAADYAGFYPQLTSSYANPTWLTQLAWAKITGAPTTLSGYGIVDPVLLSTGSYPNPSWLSSLAWSKVTGAPTSISGYGITDPLLYSTGSYSNPAWITALAWSKISGKPTTISGFGITDPIVYTTGSYSDPSWITALNFSKITGITGTPDSTKILYGDKVWRTAPAGGTGVTNLGNSTTGSTVTVTSSSGTPTTIPAATPTQAGVMSATDKQLVNSLGGSMYFQNDYTYPSDTILVVVNDSTFKFKNPHVASGSAMVQVTETVGASTMVHTVDIVPGNIPVSSLGNASTLVLNNQANNFNGYTIENYSAKFNDQGGTVYTLQASDNGKFLTFNNASAVTLTVPAGLPVGFNCMIIQKGAGQVTLTASSTTINNRNSYTKTAGQYAAVSLVSIASNVFVSGGDMQ